MIIYIYNNIWFIPLYLFISPSRFGGMVKPPVDQYRQPGFLAMRSSAWHSHWIWASEWCNMWGLPWLPHGESHVKWNTQTCHLRGTPGLSHVWGLELRIQWKMNVATLNQKWGISNLSDKLMWTFCKEKSTHLQTYHCDRCASHNLTHILTNVWSIFGKMS